MNVEEEEDSVQRVAASQAENPLSPAMGRSCSRTGLLRTSLAEELLAEGEPIEITGTVSDEIDLPRLKHKKDFGTKNYSDAVY